MALSYMEKGSGLHRALKQAGLRLQWREDIQDWVYNPADETAIQGVIDNFDPIVDAKMYKKNDIKAEAVTRAGEFIPFVRSFRNLLRGIRGITNAEASKVAYDLMMHDRQIQQNLTGPAKAGDVQWDGMLAVQSAAKDAMDAVDALTLIADVESYDEENTPVWPGGA